MQNGPFLRENLRLFFTVLFLIKSVGHELELRIPMYLAITPPSPPLDGTYSFSAGLQTINQLTSGADPVSQVPDNFAGSGLFPQVQIRILWNGLIKIKKNVVRPTSMQ